jgi:hypothetical protein
MITLDSRQLAKLDRAVGHIKDGVPKVLVPAINRAVEAGRTAVRREIRKVYIIKQKDIPVKLKRATRANLTGEIRISQGMLELGKFKVSPRGVVRTRRRRRPLHAQVRKGGSGGDIPDAFNISFAGYIGPYRRVGASRLPIRKLLAIGAPIMASQPTVGPVAIKVIGDTLDKRIDHEIKRVLSTSGDHT